MTNQTTPKKVITTLKSDIGATVVEIGATVQMNLNGDVSIPKLRKEYKLSKNQMKIMQLLSLNERAFCPIEIYKLCDLINQNAVHRLIKRALNNKWIRQLEIIRGTTINNMFAYYKEPDRLETGQTIKDHRYKYYEATKLGIKVFEINEKLK